MIQTEVIDTAIITTPYSRYNPPLYHAVTLSLRLEKTGK